MQESKEAAYPQPYFIPRHVHLCETGNQVVFLDLRRDKYLAIGRNERQALSGLVGGWPATSPALPQTNPKAGPVVQSMLKLGLLTSDARIGKVAAGPSIESIDAVLVDDDFERHTVARFSHIAAFLFACTRAALRLRLRSLEQVVELVRKRKAKALRSDDAADLERTRDLVATFDRLRPFAFTARDECLYDSLALVEFLALYKSHPTWVLGVHTQPFGAHSWVQHEGFVLNGTVEHVRRFTPILAV